MAALLVRIPKVVRTSPLQALPRLFQPFHSSSSCRAFPSDPITSGVRGSLNQPSSRETPQQLWDRYSTQVLAKLTPPPSTYEGRSVKVVAGDFSSAYRRLMFILKENNVRRTLRLTERHEKKGVKRRRIKQETHKRKFAQMIREKVRLAMTIRKRGG